ncbi:hypothetical protein ABC733_03510 [Mangrovibacter sp. SLW1]
MMLLPIFAKKVSVICEEIEKRKKEEAAHRQKQLEKLNPILELLREDKFSFDESQLTEYLLSRADSKTSLHPRRTTQKTVQQNISTGMKMTVCRPGADGDEYPEL